MSNTNNKPSAKPVKPVPPKNTNEKAQQPTPRINTSVKTKK